MITSFQLTQDKNSVPDNKGGIYFFNFRLPSDYEFGLISEDSFNIEVFINILETKISKYVKLTNSFKLSGNIDNGCADHLKFSLGISGSNNCVFNFKKIINNLRSFITGYYKALYITNIMRSFFDFSPPIYIGMTYDQSFKERLIQHMNRDTNFGRTLLELEINWSDLNYNCISIDNINRTGVRDIEKLTQHIFKPILSKC